MKSFEDRLGELNAKDNAKRRSARRPVPLRRGADLSDWVALAILAMAGFAASFPGATNILLFVLIGFPLLVSLWVASLVIVGQPLYWALRSALPRVPRLLLLPLGYLLGTGVLMLISGGLNQWVRSDVAALIANDHRDLLPLPERAVFLLQTESSECSDTCLRLLLSGKAGAVLQADPRNNTASPDLTRWAATEWRLERTGSACPKVKLPFGHRIGREPKDFSTTKLMQQRLAEGECLLAQSATGGQADVIWQFDDALRSERRHGLGAGPGAVTAQRLVIWQKQDGQFHETLRWTGATAKLLTQIPAFSITITVATGGDPSLRLVHERQQWNSPQGLRAMQGDLAVAQGPFGMDLNLVGPEAPVELATFTRGEILALLGKMRALKASEAEMIAAYQRETLPARAASGTLEQEGWEFLLRLASDRRVQVEAPLIEALESLAKGEPAREQALVGVALARIRSNFGQGERLAALVARMPLAAAAPFRDEAFAAVQWPSTRRQSYPMFPVLRAFGAEGRQKLLWLIEESFLLPIRAEARAQAWQTDYFVVLPALEGLCEAAPEAPEVGAALLALVERLQGRGIGEITAPPLLGALVQMGQPEPALRALFQAGEAPMPAEVFDAVLAEARAQPGCHFALP